ncbi:hypothetical protein AB4865_01760 [Capnocytophaga sp. ARDL2]|uniref:hypothetical protein n=1 Tax=Capnocytophaga sp. ARDL2 TaxID=3238809 RepID=UPI00355890F7
MKNLIKLLTFVGGASIFMACSSSGGSDSDDSSAFYIRYKIDGEQKEFRNSSVAANYKYIRSLERHILLDVGGKLTPTLDTKESITIDLYVPETSNTNLVAGTYSTGNSSSYYFDVKYFKETGYIYEDEFTVTFTQIDKKVAKGTFSGTLENGQVITDGEFYTKVHYSKVE